MAKKISWTTPRWTEEEIRAVIKTAKSGWLTQGQKTLELEKAISDYIGCKYCTVVNSGTSALIVALMAIKHILKKQEITITVPTYTFIASANSARFVFAEPKSHLKLLDCNKDTFNVEPKEEDLKDCDVSMVVDVFGMPCDIEGWISKCRKLGIFLIEDAAEAFGAEYKGKKVGSFGHPTIFSFHIVKQFQTIEGGCICSNDELLDSLYKKIRNQGMTQTKEKGEYLHEVFGLNFRITDLQSAIGLVQLKYVERFIEHRNKIAQLYKTNLANLNLNFQKIPSYVTKHSYMIFQLICPTNTLRGRVQSSLSSQNIEYRLCWKPVHLQPICHEMFEKFINAEWLYEHSISLPIGNTLSINDAGFVARQVMKAVKS